MSSLETPHQFDRPPDRAECSGEATQQRLQARRAGLTRKARRRASSQLCRGALEGIAVDGKEPLMPQVEAYSEVDCKAMWEILGHLRRNH